MRAPTTSCPSPSTRNRCCARWRAGWTTEARRPDNDLGRPLIDDDLTGPRATAPGPPIEAEASPAAFVATWRAATFEAPFYRAVDGRNLTAALGYYVALVVLVAGIDLFWSSVFRAAGLGGTILDAALGPGGDPWAGLIGFFLSPLIGLLMIAVSAGVTHLLLLVLGGASGGVRTTLAVYAYAYSPQIFHAVPVLGAAVAAVWSLVLLILGLREAHATDGWRAALAVLIPFAGLLTLLFMGALLVTLTGTELGI